MKLINPQLEHLLIIVCIDFIGNYPLSNTDIMVN